MDLDLYADLENPFFPVSSADSEGGRNEVRMHIPWYLHDHN